MIARPDRYEPKPNDTVQDFASHYGTSVLPARPRQPQDKAKVESAVQVVERWILMRLRHQRFESIDEVNAAIVPLLEQLNAKPFQKLPGSRASAFAELDAPALISEIEAALESLIQDIPQYVADSLREQVQRIKQIEQDIKGIEQRMALQLKTDANMKRVMQIPGVGLLTATAAIATMGEASAFKSGREFCAWLGLVPKQRGTGGKVQLLGISKRGDSYLRTLLIHGARSVLTHSKQPGPWLEQIKARRPANVVIVAQAAKMARTIWALTAKEQDYQRGYRSVRPCMNVQAA